MSTTTNNSNETVTPEAGGWTIVEIMGHRKIAGRAMPVRQFGIDGISIEPIVGDALGRPQFYPGGSLFAVHSVTEDDARRAAGTWDVRQSLQALGISAAPAVPLLAGDDAAELRRRITRAQARLQGPNTLLAFHLRKILNGDEVEREEWAGLPNSIILDENQEEGLNQALEYLQGEILAGGPLINHAHPVWGHVKLLREILDMHYVSPTDSPTEEMFTEGDEPIEPDDADRPDFGVGDEDGDEDADDEPCDPEGLEDE